MTFRLRLSPDAEDDIDEILEWSVKRFGAEVRAGVRQIRSPRHFVAYRQADGVVQVVRVLHEAMDLPRHHRALRP